METIIMIIIVCCFSIAFVSWVSSLSFRIDSNKRAINRLIEKQIFEEKIKNQERGKNGRPVSSNVPTNLEIESYFK